MEGFYKIKGTKFKLVYQGGHHNIYCDDSKHLHTDGGKCHPDVGSFVLIKNTFKCDCERWKNGNSCFRN